MVNVTKSNYTVASGKGRRKKARLSIDCTPEERLKIKLAAISEYKTVIQFVMDCVNEKLAGKLDGSFTEEDIEDSIAAIEARRKLKPEDLVSLEEVKERFGVSS